MSKIRWEPIAQELGFKDPQHMWRELYKQIGSIKGLSQRFAVSEGTVYNQLRIHDVKIKKPGGPNYVVVVITPDVIKGIRSTTIRRYARDHDIDVTTLYKALRRLGLDGKCNPRKGKVDPSTPQEEQTTSPTPSTAWRETSSLPPRSQRSTSSPSLQSSDESDPKE